MLAGATGSRASRLRSAPLKLWVAARGEAVAATVALTALGGAMGPLRIVKMLAGVTGSRASRLRTAKSPARCTNRRPALRRRPEAFAQDCFQVHLVHTSRAQAWTPTATCMRRTSGTQRIARAEATTLGGM